MITFNDIQKRIDIDFNEYAKKLLYPAGEARKYYYWSVDFFKTEGGLSFTYYPLTDEQKEKINQIGQSFFESNEIEFSVNKNSDRNDITIKNIAKLFVGADVTNQKEMYEHIKEFVLWKILIQLKSVLASELEEIFSRILLSEGAEFEHDEKKREIENFVKNIEYQKNNFLFTYVSYLCERSKTPDYDIFNREYINYLKTNQGDTFQKKLINSESKRFKEVQHKALLIKTVRLFILKSEESKIHFVFSRVDGGDKEELRELLEVMGKPETGNLYRGQASSSWQLDASITREPKFLSYEGEMYYDILSLKPDAFENDKTVYERLITMQHFGMPTRLMDITRNPLVAIFFACNNWECRDNDGVIFTFLPEKKSDFLNFEDDKLKNLPELFSYNNTTGNDKSNEFLSKIWFIKGVAKNQRINSQSGDFIFVGNGENIKKELRKLPKMTIVIDSYTKTVLLEQLESLNIHGGAVYPDLTHMSNYIRTKYLKEKPAFVVSQPEIETKPEVKKDDKKMQKFKNDVEMVLYKDYDYSSIRDKSRATQVKTFSKFYNLDPRGLDKVIDDFLFTEKRPFRDEIASICNDKLSVLKDKEKIDHLTDRVITLAKMIDKRNGK